MPPAATAHDPTPKPVLPAVPSQPDADQLGWSAELERASGADFDRLAQAAAVITGASTVLRVMRPC